MRLGLLIYGDINTVSGGYLYDRKLVDYLRAQGDQVDIVSLPRHGYSRLLTNRWLDYIPEDRGWDVLLQDELCHPSLWRHNDQLRRRVGCPLVAVVHHLRCCEDRSTIHRRLLCCIERSYLRSIDGFVYNSRATLKAVKELISASLPSIQAPPGRDDNCEAIGDDEISSRCAESNPLRVIFVGNIIERKRVHDLIEAFAGLEPGRAELRIVGGATLDPQYSRRLVSQIDEWRLNDRIRFIGQISSAQLSSLYRESHVLAVPSSYEGYGIVYLEAMGYGVVPIGAATGGASDIFDDSVEGFLIEKGDVERLTACLRSLDHDRGLLRGMALAARQRFKDHPTWDDSMARVRGFLRELIS